MKSETEINTCINTINSEHKFMLIYIIYVKDYNTCVVCLLVATSTISTHS